ncbi:MAG: ATP-binding protein [Treponema sp.]|nr:ATP-binding protein [Treponema sp.]
MKNLIKTTKTPIRYIIIMHAITQALIFIIFDLNYSLQRIIASILLIVIVLIFTNIKTLSIQLLSLILPLSVSAVEIVTASFFTDGNRIIYIFLIGCSLVGLIYINVKSLFITAIFTWVAVAFLLFVCNIRLMGSNYTFNDELFYFFGLTFIYIIVLIIGKHSVGMLSRSQKTGQTFDKVLDESSGLIVIVNNEARVEYISKSFARILDFEKQEYAINLPFVDLFPYIELKYFFGELLERNDTIETSFDIITNDDGQSPVIRSFMLHSIPMGANGIARFFDCVEITPIIESQRTAEAATRSKSEFLAMMSHEIRTPLNAIMGIAQIQLEDSSLPEKYTIAQEKIFSSGKSLLGIINDILDMSKIETGKLEFISNEYDITSLINDTVQLNMIRIGSKPIEFILDVKEDLPLNLYGDELRLKQILNNLLSNAIKYTEKGYVKLSVRHEIEQNYINLIFSVEDTGQGMKNEDIERLFTKYLRFNIDANRYTEGTGLGLNITKKLVKMMDGKINVQSEYKKGSVFTVVVKQKVSYTQDITEYTPIGIDTAQKLCNFTFNNEQQAVKLKIIRDPMPYGSVLIVDDVETNLYVAAGLLRPYKLYIETVTNGFAAIDNIKNGKNYDLILMDHMMPVMNGIEAVKKIREWEAEQSGIKKDYKRIPIVALTANALAGNEEMFVQNEFDGFIPKPIDIRLLNNILNKFIRDRNPQEAAKYKPETVIIDE